MNKYHIDEQKPTILAIDDQPAILHAVAMELRELYQVKPFISANKALEYLNEGVADLILLDYDMPEMNGLQVLERLQVIEKTRNIPVVFLTGAEHGNTEVQVLEKGASDYIQKPIKARVLQTRVRLQIELARYRSHMESLVEERTTQLRQANEKLKTREDITLNLLAEATDLRDHDTGGHIGRTTEMVRIIIRELLRKPAPGYELTEEEAENIIKSAKLHDLGKIAIPDNILLKPGKLTDDEFIIIKKHPTHGAGLLDKYIPKMGEDSFLATARDIALFHHEKWDGSGYPQGLQEEKIPLSARITALADVYDALTSARPYKNPLKHSRAVEIITDLRGTHFDPYLTDLFLKIEKSFENIISE